MVSTGTQDSEAPRGPRSGPRGASCWLTRAGTQEARPLKPSPGARTACPGGDLAGYLRIRERRQGGAAKPRAAAEKARAAWQRACDSGKGGTQAAEDWPGRDRGSRLPGWGLGAGGRAGSGPPRWGAEQQGRSAAGGGSEAGERRGARTAAAGLGPRHRDS